MSHLESFRDFTSSISEDKLEDAHPGCRWSTPRPDRTGTAARVARNMTPPCSERTPLVISVADGLKGVLVTKARPRRFSESTVGRRDGVGLDTEIEQIVVMHPGFRRRVSAWVFFRFGERLIDERFLVHKALPSGINCVADNP
jgi:hypothetical protein